MLMNWLRKARVLLPQEIHWPFTAVYEKVAVFGLRDFHSQVASEIDSTVKCGRILDAGTGPGCLLAEIARRRSDLELTGIDLSGSMLRIARGKLEKIRPGSNGARPVRFIRADVRDLPFPDGAFDLVVSTLSLHHWHDPAAGIRECLRVTACGGQCWIYDLRSDVHPRAHAELASGTLAARRALGMIFKFHGVNPADFSASALAGWLGGTAEARPEVHAAYVKLNMARRQPVAGKMVCS